MEEERKNALEVGKKEEKEDKESAKETGWRAIVQLRERRWYLPLLSTSAILSTTVLEIGFPSL